MDTDRNKLLDCFCRLVLPRNGVGDEAELSVDKIMTMVEQLLDHFPEMKMSSNFIQSALLAARFEDSEGTREAISDVECRVCDIFTTTENFSLRVLTTRILIFCYLYLNGIFARSAEAVNMANLIEYVGALFESLCDNSSIKEALRLELGKRVFCSLPGGRRSRHALLKQVADIRHDFQTITNYSLSVVTELGEVVSLHDIKPFQVVAHIDAIAELLVHQDRLYTASADGTIKAWDVLTLAELGIFVGHKKGVRAIVATGNTLFSGSSDHTIRIWNTETFKENKISLRKHQNEVSSLLIMNGRLYSGSADSTILIWNACAPSDVPEGIIRAHGDAIIALAPMRVSSRLVSACRDGFIKIWDTSSGTELLSFINPGVAGFSFAVSQDENKIFTSSWDSTIKVWNLESIEDPPIILRGHSAPVTALAVSGNRLHSGSADGFMKMWSIVTLGELSHHRGHAGRVTAIAPDKGTVFTSSVDKSVVQHFASLADLPPDPLL